MRKIFCQLSVILFVLLSTMSAFSQNNVVIDTIEIKDFSSEFLFNGRAGKIFTINSNDTLKDVIVRWNNGHFAIGTTLENEAAGKWFLYDKKNRLREYLIFGANTECILYSKKMNKEGVIISEFKALTPCF